jgi:hypothetical protein
MGAEPPSVEKMGTWTLAQADLGIQEMREPSRSWPVSAWSAERASNRKERPEVGSVPDLVAEDAMASGFSARRKWSDGAREKWSRQGS